MQRGRCLLSILLAGLLVVPVGLYAASRRADDDIERVGPHGSIDWTENTIYAIGLGAIPNNVSNDAVAYLKARDYAILDAMRNLLMAIHHVHIDAVTTGQEYMARDATIRAEVEGLLHHPRFISERRIREGRDSMVEVTMAAPLYGNGSVAEAFRSALVPQHEGTSDNGDRGTLGTEAVPAPSTPLPSVRPQVDEDSTPYTSVIIDARGYRVQRDMSPKIYAADGTEVWGTVNADPNFVIEHGIVVYAHSIAQARQLPEAGSHPLILRAIGGSNSPVHADVVLSQADAERLARLNARDGFLDRFHVIFVVDPMD
ncbi:hypothetical protein [Chthonomonas calidirosea]|uniref:hypothetical protein n=1 Tax=Chthonomonas calidirosea TaxID=454171 RepID=UPI0012E391C0|nr:hypothetical protein [Chthonomonas calidirosea]